MPGSRNNLRRFSTGKIISNFLRVSDVSSDSKNYKKNLYAYAVCLICDMIIDSSLALSILLFNFFYDNVTAIRCIHEEKNEKWKIFLHRSNDMFAIQMAPVDLQANTRVTNWIFRPEERKANKTRFLCYGKVEYSAIKGSWKNTMEQHHNGKNKSFLGVAFDARALKRLFLTRRNIRGCLREVN